MILQEPLTIAVNKYNTFAAFRIQNNRYLIFNGFQTFEGDYNNDDFIILTGKDVIPFVLVHNMRIDNNIYTLKQYCSRGGGKNYLSNIIKNSYIENELNTNLTVEDIYHEYNDYIISYDELWLMMIMYTQREYYS